MLDKIFERIDVLTQRDLQHKTLIQLYASLAEEVGELARELKIHHKVYGNTYKQPDEGIKGESVDVFISAYCMYCVAAKQIDNFTKTINPKLELKNINPGNDWDCFSNLCYWFGWITELWANPKWQETYDAFYGTIITSQEAINIFFINDGTEEEFFTLCNKKLDKWETNVLRA